MRRVSLKSVLNCLATSALALSLAACSSSGVVLTTSTLTVSSVTGAYVFSVSGTDPNDGDYFVLGNFTADGKGNITGAVADYNLGSGIDSDVVLSGTYTVSGGTATVKLTDGAAVQDTFTFPVGNQGSVAIANFDSSGSGTLYPMSPGFTPLGTYTLTLKGEGEGTVTGSGQVVAGAGGAFTSGNLTYTDAATTSTYSTVPGFVYPAAPNGRGQASIEGNNLAYYPVSSSQVLMIGLDQRALLLFTAQKM